MIVQFTNYLPKQNKWVFTEEVHASLQAAKIRAKVKGWSIVKVVKMPVLLVKQVM